MYGSIYDVAALLPGVGIDDVSVPDTGQVARWLEQGSSIINRALSAAGYAHPVPSTAEAHGEFVALANQYAAAWVMRARGLDTVQGGEESRSDRWLREFREGLAAVVAADLTAVGVSSTSTTGRNRRIRTTQIRRIDGYSGAFEGTSTEYDNVSD